MKPLLALLATTLLGVGVCACGDTSTDTKSVSHVSSSTATKSASSIPPAPADTKVDGDKDNDIGAPYDDTNNNAVLDVGHAASASERRAIVALIKRYYTAALAENGAEACGMIYSTLAEAVPEDYGLSPPGPPYMQGTTCRAVLTLLFKHFHNQLVVELPKLKVAGVRLTEHRGVAVLSFGALPERKIQVAREGHVWRVAALLDSELP